MTIVQNIMNWIMQSPLISGGGALIILLLFIFLFAIEQT